MKKFLSLSLLFVLLASALHAQMRVSGVVVNEASEPLVGVSITVEGTTMGTVTDSEGRFELQAEQDAQLEFTYAGYETRTLAAEPGMQLVLRKETVDKSHRFAVWALAGVSSPLEAYTTPGKFGSYSYVGGGVGLGYHFRCKKLLIGVGAEAKSMNYKMDLSLLDTAAGTINFDVRSVRVQVPAMVGMEMEHWYWLLGEKLGFYTYNYLFNKHEDIKQATSDMDITFALAGELGLNFDRPQTGANYKIALTAETLLDPQMKTNIKGWWVQILLGAKCTISLCPRQ